MSGRGLPSVAVVGPVAPFRGGIAHHTTLLAEALSSMARVRVVSYKRLYPSWLYPGRFITEETRTSLPDENVSFILDSVDPRSWSSAFERLHEWSPRLVIVPWWTFFLAPATLYLIRRLRAAGIPVLFVCHNVVDHETAAWKLWISKRVLRQGRWFLVHAAAERRKLEAVVPGADVLCHRHPVPAGLPEPVGRFLRRARLELLFFGFIRPYKGLQTLIEAMTLLRDVDVYLSVVGEPWGEGAASWQRRVEAAGIQSRVELVPRYVSHGEAAEYFHRADVVVLPYTAATGTAVIATAARYGKPVVASRVGGVEDVVEDGVTGLLIPPGDATALARAIRQCASGEFRCAPGAIQRISAAHTWKAYAGRLLEHASMSAHGGRAIDSDDVS